MCIYIYTHIDINVYESTHTYTLPHALADNTHDLALIYEYMRTHTHVHKHTPVRSHFYTLAHTQHKQA